MSPAELAAAGVSGANDVFTALQRPWRWGSTGPLVAPRIGRHLAQLAGGMDEPLASAMPTIAERRASADGSTRLVLAFGEDVVEAVHMPRAVRNARVSLCVSSQVGCAMGCTFCATSRMGFRRHLSAGEIVAQVLAVVRELGPRHPSELTIVFMGMGEPLHNLQNVAQAIRIFCHPGGLGLSPRRITVSTSGLVPEIQEFGSLPLRPLLALSLNATTDELRQELMPVNRRYPLAALRAALIRYPWRPRERATIEYVLLAGVNDTDADAERLADFCAGVPHQINLIPFNAHPYASFDAPDDREVDRFATRLLSRRPTIVTVRRSRGRDVQAACGQLVQNPRTIS